MPHDIARKRLETKAIVVGYAMSRLDRRYLLARGWSNWRQAFGEASQLMKQPAATFKNLRDEFDPVHPNSRVGWDMRPLRANRQTVLEELQEVSDEAVMELVSRILSGSDEETREAIDSLARTTKVAANVAERLLTGRRAEDYFMSHCLELLNIRTEHLLDCRNAAVGYDFGACDNPRTAIEVKGIKNRRGDVLFTDREWSEAKFRRSDYWLVIVGNRNRSRGSECIGKQFFG